MRNIIVANKKPIPIGRYGENEETTVQFSINAFFPDMPDADFGLVHQRHGDAAPYPCVISELNGFINWRIGSADVAKVGSGTAQLSAYKNGSISKTVIFTTETLNSLGMVDPPSPETAWVDEVLTAGTAAVNAAERASTYAERAQAVADNIDTIVSESLDEAKESGEFDGPPGDPGFSPAVIVTDITGGHRVTITDAEGDHAFNVMNGPPGPAYTLTEEDKAEIVADVVDEIPLVDPDAKTSGMTQSVGVDANGKLWTAPGGQGGTTDYDQLSNRPSINGHTLTGNQTAAQLGLATPSDIPTVPAKTSDLTNDSGFVDASGAAAAAPVQSVNNKTGAVTLTAADVGAGTYSKPSGGIPATDLAAAVRTLLGKADAAYVKPAAGIPATDLAAAIQTTLSKAEVALSNRTKNVVLIGDSYGLDTAGWTGWQTAISSIINVAAMSAVGGSGFLGDPNVNTFLQQLQSLTVADKTAVTDIVVLGGYNDASMSASEANLNTAVGAFAAYCRANYPLAKIHYGFIAVDYNNTGMQATLNAYRYMFQRVCSRAGISFIQNAPYILLNKSLLYFASGDANSGFHPNTSGGAEVAKKIAEYLYSGNFDVIYGETALGLTIYAKNGEVSISPVQYSFSTILSAMTYPFNTWTLLADLSQSSDLLWGTHDDLTTFRFWAAVYTPSGLISHALFKIQDKGLYINPLNNNGGLVLSAAGWACIEGMPIPMQTNY